MKQNSFFRTVHKGRNAEVIITVKDAGGSLPNENDYWRTIDTSINDLKEGKGTAFTMESFEKFICSEQIV